MALDGFKVIIVGGGPVGLTAAHALHLAGIDFVVLERRKTVIEDVGASLVLTPGSLRVMHQFGLLDTLLAIGHEVTHSRSFEVEGNAFYDSTILERVRINHGCAPVAFHRAELVEALYDGLPEAAKSKVLLGKKLADIKSNTDGVVVTCDDGTSYHGSVALGADGVHSKTRLLMRELALEENPSRSWDAENPFVATYSCLWSSFPRPSDAGQGFDTHHKDMSVMYLTGRERGWIFLYRKLPEPTRGRVSYTEKDLEECVEDFGDFPVHDSFKVKDVWARRLTAGMANLDEGVAENWTWGRVVIAGDAAHKFTPNSGQGLNAGIQDVVRLCNGLRALQGTESVSPPETRLAETLAAYELERRADAKAEIGRAAMTTRCQARANPLYYFVSRYILTIYLVQYLLIELAMKPIISNSLVLDYVNVDERLRGAAAWKHALPGVGPEK